jgi:hypothetical protein
LIWLVLFNDLLQTEKDLAKTLGKRFLLRANTSASNMPTMRAVTLDDPVTSDSRAWINTNDTCQLSAPSFYQCTRNPIILAHLFF